MNRSALAFALLLLRVPALSATTQSDVVLTGKPHMEFDCPSNIPLHLHVRSGEILIVGTDDHEITDDLAGKNADKIQDVKGRLSFRNNVAILDLPGGPRSELQIIIHVPKNSDLTARIFAGEVNVHDVTGNKDFELHAGQLTISVDKPEQYGHVDVPRFAREIQSSRPRRHRPA
jgi:hypothetical protein